MKGTQFRTQYGRSITLGDEKDASVVMETVAFHRAAPAWAWKGRNGASTGEVPGDLRSGDSAGSGDPRRAQTFDSAISKCLKKHLAPIPKAAGDHHCAA